MLQRWIWTMKGLMKNRYVYRSFIAPSQQELLNLVRMKLVPVHEIIDGKEVILIDDSIGRGIYNLSHC